MAYDDPFCSKEKMTTIFYKSRHFNVLYDKRPVVKGHILIASRRHVTDFLQLSREEFLDFYATISKIIPKLLELYDATEGSYNITAQIGRFSGHSIDHLHVHIIPRSSMDPFQGDDVKLYKALDEKATEFSPEDVERETKRLRAAFRYAKGR